MAYDYEIKGFDELAAKMSGIAAEIEGPMLPHVVMAGARVFKRGIEERAPILDKKTANSTSLEPGALKADIHIAMLKDEAFPTAVIGPGKKTGYVARFVEYGHREVHGGQSKVLAGGKTRGPGIAGEDVPAHPFIRPTFEADQGAAQQAMVEEFGKLFEGVVQ